MHKTMAVALVALTAGSSALACDYRLEINEVLDVGSSDSLSIEAAAGDLEIVRSKSSDEVSIRGIVCASSKELQDAASLDIAGGSSARIAVVLPEMKSNWSWTGQTYVAMDLELSVPADLPLKIRDSSGDVEISGTGPVDLTDSSGDIELNDIEGDIVLSDSSGDIDLRDITGDVTVGRDSSGDMEGRRITGNVRVVRDSSGDIRFREVSSNVVIEADSSGDIVAETVGGDFVVQRDGSGSISHRDITGSVEIPEGK